MVLGILSYGKNGFFDSIEVWKLTFLLLSVGLLRRFRILWMRLFDFRFLLFGLALWGLLFLGAFTSLITLSIFTFTLFFPTSNVLSKSKTCRSSEDSDSCELKLFASDTGGWNEREISKPDSSNDCDLSVESNDFADEPGFFDFSVSFSGSVVSGFEIWLGSVAGIVLLRGFRDPK